MGARYLHSFEQGIYLVEDLEVYISILLVVYLIYFTINYVIPLNYDILI